MQTLWQVLFGVLAVASLATLVYWGVAIFKIAVTVSTIPTARRGLSLPTPLGSGGRPPSVCVIVPAHNEESVIAQLVASLKGQDYPNLRVVLALDRCTDQTVLLARKTIGDDPRFEVMEITSCAEGWAGKVHAVHSGSTRSAHARDAELLLFADADTVFDPGCVRATVALLHERKLDLLSLLSTLTHDRWYEVWVQPAAGLELMRQYPITRANSTGDARRAFANGQFMLFRADAYRAVGGHEGVKDELLEDLALARRMAEHNRPAGVFVAAGVLRCRMYHSWAEFTRGWKRIYTEAAKRKDGRLVKSAWQARLFGTIFPLASYGLMLLTMLKPGAFGDARDGSLLLAAAAVVVFHTAIAWAYTLGGSPLWCALGHPLGAWRIASILSHAAQDLRRGTPTVWGGKSYVRERRV